MGCSYFIPTSAQCRIQSAHLDRSSTASQLPQWMPRHAAQKAKSFEELLKSLHAMKDTRELPLLLTLLLALFAAEPLADSSVTPLPNPRCSPLPRGDKRKGLL